VLAGVAVGEQLTALERPVAGVQEQETPPEPERGVDWPAQIVAEPEALAVGRGLTVTLALPDEVPAQFASETAVTVYVVVEPGLTLRVAGLEVTPVCVTPSDHVKFQGLVPVSVAWIVAEEPWQIDVEPLTVAFGNGLTVIVTVGLFVEAHPLASLTVNVYVVVAEGLARGVQLFALSRPVAGVQEQETPPEPERGAEPPAQIVAVPEATAVGGEQVFNGKFCVVVLLAVTATPLAEPETYPGIVTVML
jgi:hypothetical protein